MNDAGIEALAASGFVAAVTKQQPAAISSQWSHMLYVEAAKDLSPRSDGNWRLAPLPRTVTATYLTSPLAAQFTPPPHVKLTAMGPALGGYAKFRVETQ